MRFVFLFMLLLPVAEIWSLIEVGSRLGVIPTIVLVILSAMLGLQLLRRQGVSTLLRINQKLATGELPAEEVVNGLLLATAGVLLIIPGFITDVMALFCLFPLTRLLIGRILLKRILAHPGVMTFTVMGSQGSSPRDGFSADFVDRSQDSNIYEGEYRDVKDEKTRLPPE